MKSKYYRLTVPRELKVALKKLKKDNYKINNLFSAALRWADKDRPILQSVEDRKKFYNNMTNDTSSLVIFTSNQKQIQENEVEAKKLEQNFSNDKGRLLGFILLMYVEEHHPEYFER